MEWARHIWLAIMQQIKVALYEVKQINHNYILTISWTDRYAGKLILANGLECFRIYKYFREKSKLFNLELT